MFTDAGLSASFYDQLKYITHDEEGHVVALEAIITAAGGNPVQACTYNFPMSTPQEFIKLASVVEGLGVSAYLGAARKQSSLPIFSPALTTSSCSGGQILPDGGRLNPHH